jgi:TetR/AcrR family transcriptional repressor of nem operon
MPMVRPREFDEDAALEAAVMHFWRHGFEATSVRTLADRMGITGASLYNAFGDKRSLYRRALAHYLEHTVGDRLARLGQLAPRDAIETFLREIIERSVNDEQRKGCMLVNTALELAPHDREFKRTVARALEQVEMFFLNHVRAGQSAGTITLKHSAEDLARLLMSVLLGIRVLSRSRPERTLLEGTIRPVLYLLDT